MNPRRQRLYDSRLRRVRLSRIRQDQAEGRARRRAWWKQHGATVVATVLVVLALGVGIASAAVK